MHISNLLGYGQHLNFVVVDATVRRNIRLVSGMGPTRTFEFDLHRSPYGLRPPFPPLMLLGSQMRQARRSIRMLESANLVERTLVVLPASPQLLCCSPEGMDRWH